MRYVHKEWSYILKREKDKITQKAFLNNHLKKASLKKSEPV